MEEYLSPSGPSRRQSLEASKKETSVEQNRRASLISDAAVERGRVNNAMNQLKRVEDERAKMELETRNLVGRIERECALEIKRKETKIDDLMKQLEEREKTHAQGEVTLETTKLNATRYKDRAEQAEARCEELASTVLS